jgi:soluble lytic murein transglycosylase-like protein
MMALCAAFAIAVSALVTPAHAAPADSAGCPAVIVEVFGDRAADACYVAWHESSWRAGATGALGERGLFQIHPIHADSTYDPYGNALAAYRLSGGGYNWCRHWRWTCS